MAQDRRQKAVPKSRIARLSRVARIAGGVASGAVAEGARQLVEGQKPSLSSLMLTPSNASRIAKHLSAMRGAAMKVGQLLSMETDGFLPDELTTVLAQLRDNAYTMPTDQLLHMLLASYGPDWRSNFKTFDMTPLAAASIGQVHQASTLSDEPIVLKVQYPGVRESIDSDVDNIAWLLKISNLVPEQLDMETLLEEAKQQLKEEANYYAEGSHLAAFYQSLISDERYLVPWYYDELSSDTILAMEYLPGRPIEEMANLDQEQADTLMHNLIELMLKELFELRLMQTDPNFANYRYQPASGQLVLLDFGATRKFNQDFVVNYKRLIRAVIARDDNALLEAADRLGYDASSASPEYQRFLLEIFYLALEPFSFDGQYDFGGAKLSERLAERSDDAFNFKEFWRTPPTDILYLHRKLGGTFLLAARVKAKVNCHQLISPWLKRLR